MRRSEPESHLQLSKVPDGRTLGDARRFIASHSSLQMDGQTLRASLLKLLTEALCAAAAAAARTLAFSILRGAALRFPSPRTDKG